MIPRARLLAILLVFLCPAGLFAAEADGPVTDRIIVKWRATPDRATRVNGQERVHALARRAGTPLRRGRHLGGSLSVLELAGERAEAVDIPPEPELDEAWAEPEAFGGCSTAGQSRPEQPQPIHIVRPARNHQPGAQA